MTPELVGSRERECDGMSKPVMTPGREYDMLSQKDGSKRQVHGAINFLKSEVIKELAQYCGRINPSSREVASWPPSVANRWMNINKSKSSYELGILSWNVNGRLDFRGCREC